MSKKAAKQQVVEPLIADEVPADEVKTPDPTSEQKPTTSEIAIREQAKKEIEAPRREDIEEKALKVSDAQLKRYWTAREAERKVQRGRMTTMVLPPAFR